jgi:hypothetical protein
MPMITIAAMIIFRRFAVAIAAKFTRQAAWQVEGSSAAARWRGVLREQVLSSVPNVAPSATRRP